MQLEGFLYFYSPALGLSLPIKCSIPLHPLHV